MCLPVDFCHSALAHSATAGRGPRPAHHSRAHLSTDINLGPQFWVASATTASSDELLIHMLGWAAAGSRLASTPGWCAGAPRTSGPIDVTASQTAIRNRFEDRLAAVATAMTAATTALKLG
jgi:hypothetical protein